MIVNFNIYNNHIILNTEAGPTLLDTGSPISIGNGLPGLTKAPSQHIQQLLSGSINLDNISELLGTQLSGLLGADSFNDRILQIDWERQSVHFYKEGEFNKGENDLAVPFQTNMGIILFSLNIGGSPITAYFDTGAHISYISSDQIPESTRLSERVEVVDDFYPTMGRFQTSVYIKPVNLVEREFKMRFGVLPQTYEKLFFNNLLSETPIKSIIGNDLFKEFPVIVVDYIHNELVF